MHATFKLRCTARGTCCGGVGRTTWGGRLGEDEWHVSAACHRYATARHRHKQRRARRSAHEQLAQRCFICVFIARLANALASLAKCAVISLRVLSDHLSDHPSDHSRYWSKISRTLLTTCRPANVAGHDHMHRRRKLRENPTASCMTSTANYTQQLDVAVRFEHLHFFTRLLARKTAVRLSHCVCTSFYDFAFAFARGRRSSASLLLLFYFSAAANTPEK